MDGGFDITFREVVPDSGIVELAVAELDQVAPRAGTHCSVVLRRSRLDPFPFEVHIELHGRPSSQPLSADAIDGDQQFALRRAFAALRSAYRARAAARETLARLEQRPIDTPALLSLRLVDNLPRSR